jgi:hypothetical protein
VFVGFLSNFLKFIVTEPRKRKKKKGVNCIVQLQYHAEMLQHSLAWAKGNRLQKKTTKKDNSQKWGGKKESNENTQARGCDRDNRQRETEREREQTKKSDTTKAQQIYLSSLLLDIIMI